MSKTISVDRRGTKVIINVREYCAIEGRTTASDLIQMSADEARAHASHLQLCADGAEEESRRLSAEQLQAKKEKLEALKEDIRALESEIARQSLAS